MNADIKQLVDFSTQAIFNSNNIGSLPNIGVSNGALSRNYEQQPIMKTNKMFHSIQQPQAPLVPNSFINKSIPTMPSQTKAA